jgi:hypothetical protein
VEGSRQGTREGREAIEEGKREHDLGPCASGAVVKAFKVLVFAEQADVVRPRVEGRGLGSKDCGGVVAPNPWRRLEVDEGGGNGFDLVKKTSSSCGGE